MTTNGEYDGSDSAVTNRNQFARDIPGGDGHSEAATATGEQQSDAETGDDVHPEIRWEWKKELERLQQQNQELRKQNRRQQRQLRSYGHDPDHPSGDGETATGPFERYDVQTAPELIEEDLDPLEPLLEYDGRQVLPEGATVVGGKPKCGKTFFALNVAEAVAHGGKALGYADARQGRVLYLNRDGDKRGMKDRLDTICGDERPEQLYLLHDRDFPRVGEGAIEWFDEACFEYPDLELVVVDVLKKLRPREQDGNAYQQDYDYVSKLADLGRDHNVSFLLIHHVGKNREGDDIIDRISGSFGLTASVENVLGLDTAGKPDGKATLELAPREAPREEFNLEFDGQLMTWRLADPCTASTPKRQAVVEVLKSADRALSREEIAHRLDEPEITADAVGKRLNNLNTEDNVPVERPERGRYTVA